MRSIVRIEGKGKNQGRPRNRGGQAAQAEPDTLNTRVEMIQALIPLGVTLGGQKVVLGFVQTATENERVCSTFLRGLLDRGLRIDQGILCVSDGAKGLRKAADTVFAKRAAVQRCQGHKRENVVSYLPKHGWLATALLEIEPRLRKVAGQRQLVRLRSALHLSLKGGGERVA